jgi:hypothetical protein
MMVATVGVWIAHLNSLSKKALRLNLAIPTRPRQEVDFEFEFKFILHLFCVTKNKDKTLQKCSAVFGQSNWLPKHSTSR